MPIRSRAQQWFQGLNHLFFILTSIVTVIPLIYVLSVSLTSDSDIAHYGYSLIPEHITGKAYTYLLQTPKQLINAYVITIIVTVVGTILSLVLTTTVAYVMTRRDYRYHRITTFYVFFTMLFNGGLVPTYMVMTKILHLQDTIFALFLPYGVSAWFAMLMRGFLMGMPFEVVESAKIDGASELRIFAGIIVPLSKPALATVGLFYALGYWNDWWLAMLYISDANLIPLQYLLQSIMSNLEHLTSHMQAGLNINLDQIPGESARMAIAVLAIGPMMFVFPFFQKYIVRGLTLGAVKG
ncbi:carbohydrate ABC transporter permease [Paenibacillus alba]|uniref:Carbohydrate ABC transporter permease n=1 Tax=Paenibacillus alba TaxID=1197127 RepID=A0ABU6G3M5_9BACL|nr:carbohydrate ABC transporter permease [Paenibacillus alba]MEC0228731.1 carbohydrate ABC transporter permease [Paenibacillus alba]NQX67522.1 carbohydrate ABC transporter permease [Paenibacillus alba]